ncbi:MAG: hypothetical protein JWN51_1140 [Phycisphaerales bacterium]|nr:hypothetical protein [Phycisphaerales bacterium]
MRGTGHEVDRVWPFIVAWVSNHGVRYAARVGGFPPIQAIAQAKPFGNRRAIWPLRSCLGRPGTADACGVPQAMGWKPMPQNTGTHGDPTLASGGSGQAAGSTFIAMDTAQPPKNHFTRAVRALCGIVMLG